MNLYHKKAATANLKNVFYYNDAKINNAFSFENVKEIRIACFNNYSLYHCPGEHSRAVSFGKSKIIYKGVPVIIKYCNSGNQLDIFDPDLVLYEHAQTTKASSHASYVVLNSVYEMGEEDVKGSLAFDGYLMQSEPEIKKVRTALKNYKKEIEILHPYWSSVPSTQFHEAFPDPSNLKLAYISNNLEAKTGNKPRFETLIKTLTEVNKVDFLELYGDPAGWSWLGDQSYIKGMIPYSDKDVFGVYRSAGVGLAICPNHFYDRDVGNNRVYEITASGAVCIADDLPFYKKTFGDSLLYITTRDEEEKAKQIINHFNWIKSYPKKAKEKARKAHEVFFRELSYEVMIRKLIDFHYQLQNKKNNNISMVKKLFV